MKAKAIAPEAGSIPPLFMGSNGIWWTLTIAETLAAVVAIICMAPQLNIKRKPVY